MPKKYEEIKKDLFDKIVSGQYALNEKLPTESELMEIYKVSRFTVRHAIGELEKENYVYRIQGGGIFVDDWKNKPKSAVRNKTIGVITTHIADYIFPNIITGIDNSVSQFGYSILIGNTQNNPDKERATLKNLIVNDLSGLIIEPTKSAMDSPNLNIYRNLKQTGVPMLFINATYDGFEDTPYLIMDDVKVGKIAANYLISKGHKHIVGIFKVDDKQGIKRMSGFIKAFQLHPELSDMSEIMMYQTEENIDNLLNKLKEKFMQSRFVPTAIICYNDQLAIQVINRIKEMGLKIPDDVSIMGVDDYQFSKFLNPKLTTIRHPQEKMGLDAGKMIIDMLNKQTVQSKVYEPTITERDSVRIME